MIASILAVALALATFPAQAHDRWATGEPVPAFAKSHCCGKADLHRYSADEVHQDKNGDWILPDYPRPIPNNADNVYASGDQYYYAFFSEDSEGPTKAYGTVWCFYRPVSG